MRFTRQRQQLAVRDQRQPGIGDFRHEHELRCGTRLLEPEIVLERGATQAAHAAEEIELEGRHTEARGVGAIELTLPGLRQARRNARVGRRTLRIDGRHEFGALDAVLRTRRLDVERGDAQIPVVSQRARQQILQFRVGEEFLPADIPRGRRHRHRGRGHLGVFVLRLHGSGRLFIVAAPSCRRRAPAMQRKRRREISLETWARAHVAPAYGTSAGVSSTFMVTGFTLK